MRTLDEANLKIADRRAVEEASRLLRAALPVERIVLYGSKARGEDDAESDIDLLVLTSRPLTQQEDRAVIALLQPVQHRHDVMLSTLRVPLEEWEHGLYQVMPIRVEVDRDGVAA